MPLFTGPWSFHHIEVIICISFCVCHFSGKNMERISTNSKRRVGGWGGLQRIRAGFYLSVLLPPYVCWEPTGSLCTSCTKVKWTGSCLASAQTPKETLSSHHPETEHICSVNAAFPDLGHGNHRTFPKPGLISLLQLDYWRMQLTKGTYYL